MRYYNAVFCETPEAIEVEFPDLPGCFTFGKTWEEALVNATDVLSGWLAHAQPEFVRAPGPYEQIKHKRGNEAVIPIAVDEQIMSSYLHGRNLKVSFPPTLVKKLNHLSKVTGVKRDHLIREAVAEYVAKKS